MNTTTENGGGFSNVLAGVEHFPAHIVEWFKAQEAAHPDIQAILTLLSGSIKTIANDIVKVGLPVVQKEGATLMADVSAAVTGGIAKSVAGAAAVASLKTAGSQLEDDTLHALVTSALAEAPALITATETAVEDAAKTI